MRRFIARWARVAMVLAVIGSALATSSCNGNVYVGVAVPGPYVGYPYGHPYGYGGVVVGRPIGW